MNFDEVLDSIEAQGYTIISIQPDDDNPYSKIVVAKDSSGSVIKKHYVLSGYTDITDDNGVVIGVDEDWQEVD